GELGEQPSQRRSLSCHKRNNGFGSAARSLVLAGVREIGHRQRSIQRQVRKIISAKTLRQSMAANFGIGKFVELFGVTLSLRLCGADDRAESRQDENLPGVAALGLDQPLEVRVEGSRGCFLEMRGEYRFRMARSELFARVR